MGKSQLLQAAASISPRGIYICGNATTNAGLTVAVVKDPLTGDYAFEAGNGFFFFLRGMQFRNSPFYWIFMQKVIFKAILNT